MSVTPTLPSLPSIFSGVEFPTPNLGWDMTGLPTVTDPAIGAIAGIGNQTPVTTVPTATGSTVAGPGMVSQIRDGVSRFVFGFSLEDGIFIVVGIILIAAGLFTFKGTQNIIVSTARAAKGATKAAAEVAA